MVEVGDIVVRKPNKLNGGFVFEEYKCYFVEKKEGTVNFYLKDVKTIGTFNDKWLCNIENFNLVTSKPKYKIGEIINTKEQGVQANNIDFAKQGGCSCLSQEDLKITELFFIDDWFWYRTEKNNLKLNLVREDAIISKEQVIEYKQNKNEETKMENYKEFNKNNLKEAKKIAQQERNTYEIEQAKKEYVKLIDKKEKLERDIKTLAKEINKVQEDLKVFM